MPHRPTSTADASAHLGRQARPKTVSDEAPRAQAARGRTPPHAGDAGVESVPAPERSADDRDLVAGSAASGSIPSTRDFIEASHSIEPPSVPDGTFVRVLPEEHPLPRATECTVYFQDYHRSSSKLGRFAKIVGVDAVGGEYLLMLDNYESLSAPMRRVEWRKITT